MSEVSLNPADHGHVVVIGGGTMGAGIAQVMLEIAERVTIVESADQWVDAAIGRVADGLRRRHKRADDPEAAAAEDFSRLSVVVGLPTDTTPSLVIEAVPEVLGLKRTVLAQVEEHWPTLPLLASNTSSISISDLGQSLTRTDRFLGMHFFNPVPVSDLVELVVGTGTSDQAVAAARSWVDALSKEAIVVNDSPGFATSRLGLALGLEAIRMVESGVASASDIDTGMVLGYKHPMGPLRLTDLVGLDVRLGIAEQLAEHLGPRFEPPALLRRMVEQGDVGKKSGRGFYEWH